MPRKVPRETFASLAARLQLPLITAVYGFGSYFRDEDVPEDVDILLVFENDAVHRFREAIQQASAYARAVGSEVGEEPHVTRLTEQEFAETNFVREVGAELLWKRSGEKS